MAWPCITGVSNVNLWQKDTLFVTCYSYVPTPATLKAWLWFFCPTVPVWLVKECNRVGWLGCRLDALHAWWTVTGTNTHTQWSKETLRKLHSTQRYLHHWSRCSLHDCYAGKGGGGISRNVEGREGSRWLQQLLDARWQWSVSFSLVQWNPALCGHPQKWTPRQCRHF